MTGKFREYSPRLAKAVKILAVLQDFVGPQLTDATCLDIGCASGVIPQSLAQYVKGVVGVDIDQTAVQIANAQNIEKNVSYVIANGEGLPLPAESFDVILCAQVYEHTISQQALADEIWRVLRPGGICFFSGPNRLAVIEEHYWLPFLSWLPRSIADIYMRLFRRGDVYDIRPMFYWQLCNMWRRFKKYDYTIRLIKDPEHFAIRENMGKMRWVSRLPNALLKLSIILFPNYNWILIKVE
jgi:SAM-dependent methyltransferase